MMRIILAVVLVIAVLTGPAVAEFKAGVAVRNVTPDKLLPISGGAGPSEPATQKKGELTVRALVVEQGDVRVAIVGSDFLGFPGVLADRVRERQKSVAPECILIGVTHCHSAPDMYAFPDGQGGTDADLDYIDSVCTSMAEAIDEAAENLQPAAVKIATDEAQGKIAYNYYAPQLYDPRCHVMQFIDESGEPVATLINYASHPEVLGPDRGILSPDFCGPLYDRVEELGGGVGIYMNSAQGGMVTADVRGEDGKDVQTWEECIRIGNLMAEEGLRIVKDAPVQENPGLFCAAKDVKFPVDSPLLKAILEGSPLSLGGDGDGNVTTQMNVVNLGNAQILTIPGEALPNIGYYLKRNMHGEHNFLFGLTNDAFGYILTKEDFNSFRRYRYISETSLGERTGGILVDEGLAFVNECPKPEKLQ